MCTMFIYSVALHVLKDMHDFNSLPSLLNHIIFKFKLEQI